MLAEGLSGKAHPVIKGDVVVKGPVIACVRCELGVGGGELANGAEIDFFCQGIVRAQKLHGMVLTISAIRAMDNVAAVLGKSITCMELLEAVRRTLTIQGAPELFADRRSQPDTSEEALKAELYQQIGQLQVELDWLKKKSGLSR